MLYVLVNLSALFKALDPVQLIWVRLLQAFISPCQKCILALLIGRSAMSPWLPNVHYLMYCISITVVVGFLLGLIIYFIKKYHVSCIIFYFLLCLITKENLNHNL
jgi:hypothetical protein